LLAIRNELDDPIRDLEGVEVQDWIERDHGCVVGASERRNKLSSFEDI
jgi:hypothetical protein